MTWEVNGVRRLQVANLQGPTERPDSTGAFYLISAGGTNVQNDVVKSVDLFNTTGRSWTPAPPMNFGRARFQLTSLYNGTNAAVATGGIQVQLPTALLHVICSTALGIGTRCIELFFLAAARSYQLDCEAAILLQPVSNDSGRRLLV